MLYVAIALGSLALGIAVAAYIRSKERRDPFIDPATAGRIIGLIEKLSADLSILARSSEVTAESARSSANSAGQAITGLNTMVELGTRAFVHATEFKIIFRPQTDETISLEVWVANVGKTAARELKIASNFLLLDEVPDELVFKPRVHNIVLGSGVSFSLSHFQRVTGQTAVAITQGKKLLVSCGVAEYRDIFNQMRETRWCAVYNHNSQSFVAYPRHNSAS